MNFNETIKILKNWEWKTLQNLYGNAHSSIIGFISTNWIKQSMNNTVYDGAPSPVIGKGRTGQRNADLLLLKDNKPFITVEVETQVKNYIDKIDALNKYLTNPNDYDGIEFCLLVMANLTTGENKYKHCWTASQKRIQQINAPISLVSIKKEYIPRNRTEKNQLLWRNAYYPWKTIEICYWIYLPGYKQQKEGILWMKN